MNRHELARDRAIRELASHGLIARYLPAEDESVDDGIDAWIVIDGKEVEVGSIQICRDGDFAANILTDDGDAMLHGVIRDEISTAVADLVDMLIRDGHDGIATRAELAFPDFDDVGAIRRLVRAGCHDMSWRNDACPRLTFGSAGVWVDFIDDGKSERLCEVKPGDGVRRRFLVFDVDQDGAPLDGDVAECLTAEEALAEMARLNAMHPARIPAS